MRAAIYCRVSSKKQSGEDHYSLPHQIARGTQYCEERGYTIHAVLEEVHTGGELDERPQMTRLREMMNRREIDVVVFTVLDRLARDQNHQEVLLYFAKKNDVKIESTEEPLEDTPIGRHIRSLRGFVAEIQRDDIRRNSMQGKQRRVEQGHMMPGNRPLYGYQWADDGKARKTHYILHPITAPIARRIFEEAASGKPLRRIAFDLTAEGIPTPSDQFRQENGEATHGDAWASSTIWNILKHPAYYGQHSAFRWTHNKRKDRDSVTGNVNTVIQKLEREVGGRRILLPHSAPPLISEEIALAVAKRLEHNKLVAARNNPYPEIALLRGGFAVCGFCGTSLHVHLAYHRPGSRSYVYKCSRVKMRGPLKCKGAQIAVSILDQGVWDNHIMQLLRNPQELEQAITRASANDTTSDDLEGMAKRIRSLEAQSATLRKAIGMLDSQEDEDEIAKFVADLRQLSRQKQKATEERIELEKRHHERKLYEARLRDVRLYCEALEENKDSLTYQDKRAVLYGLNTRVEVYPDGSEHRYVVHVSSPGVNLWEPDVHGENGSPGSQSMSLCPAGGNERGHSAVCSGDV